MAKLSIAKKTVFISVKIMQPHSPKETTQDHDRVATELSKKLEKEGFIPFLSTNEHTDEWKLRIKQEIKDSFAFVLISSNTDYINKSEAIQDEIGYFFHNYNQSEDKKDKKIFKRLHTSNFNIDDIEDESIKKIEEFDRITFDINSKNSINNSIQDLIDDLKIKSTHYDDTINRILTPEEKKTNEELIIKHHSLQEWFDQNTDNMKIKGIMTKDGIKNEVDEIHYFSNLPVNTLNSFITELQNYKNFILDKTSNIKSITTKISLSVTVFENNFIESYVEKLETSKKIKEHTHNLILKKKSKNKDSVIVNCFKKVDKILIKKYSNVSDSILHKSPSYSPNEIETYGSELSQIHDQQIYSFPIKKNISYALYSMQFSLVKSLLFKRETYKVEFIANGEVLQKRKR